MIKISKFSNTVEYNLRTTLDASGITQLQSEISKTLRTLDELGNKKLLSQSQVTSATKDIQQLQSAFSKAFDSNIGMLNLKTFQKELGGLNVDSLRQSFANAGVQGTQLFNNMIGQIGKMDTNFKNLSSTTDKIFNTMGNTVRWGVTASIFQRIQNSIYGAVEYVQELDRSLNDIRIVSGQSADQMREFSLYANEAAQSLGQTTTAFTDASLIFLQQGLDQNTSNQLADLTLRMANVTGQDTATASEQITSIMNGYNMTIAETESAIDTLANVAAQGASDMEELATAESRVASTASTLGVSQEQLAAQISTMISVTRQAPETVGNSLRTLYSRLADLKMGDTLEDGVNLGQFSQAVEDVGVQVLDQTGNLRNMGDIIEDLMVKWQDLSSAQQISLGTTLAGRYQLNQFLTLMNNMEMYNEQLAIAEDSAGTLDEQQSIYMDSMAAKVNQLTAAGEGLVSTLFNPDDYKPALDVLTQLINGLTDLINITGGAGNAFLGLGSIITKTFSTQIGRGISNLIQNQQRQKLIRENPVNASAVLSFMGAANPGEDSAAYQFVDKNYSQQPYMSTEQVQQYNNLLEQTVEIENKLVEVRKTAATTQSNLTKADSIYTNLTKLESSLDKETGLFKDDTAKESMKAVAQDYGEIATKVSNLRKELTKTSTADYGDTLQRYTSRLQDFANECNYAKEDVEALALKIDDLANATRQDIADSGILQDLDKLETEATRRQQATTAVIEAEKRAKEAQMAQSYAQDRADNQRRVNDIFSEGMDLQQQYSSIAQAIGAVGQLAFAWQSFQSLGSLWANADLSTGEKVQQTIMNLLVTVPQLVMAFADMQEVVSRTSFGDLAGTLSNYSKEAFASARANLSFSASGIAAAASSTAMGTASKLASGGIKLLSNALNTLTGPIGIAITLGTMLASTLISASEAAREANLDSGMKQYEDAQAAASLDFSGFDAAYDEYKRTGNVSDELRTSSEQLAESLGVVGAQALINADNFGELADRINEAKEASQTEVNQAAKNQLNAISADTSSYNLFQDDFQHAIYGDSEFQSRTGISQNGWGTDTSGMDAVEKLGAMNQALEESNAKMKELREQQQQFDEGSTVFEELQRQIDKEQEIYDRISSLAGQYNFDDVAQITQEQAKAAESALDITDFQGMTVEEITNALTDRSGDYSAVANYYATLGDDAGQAYIDSLLRAIASGNSQVAAELANQDFASILDNSASGSEISTTLSSGETDLKNATQQAYDSLSNEQKIELVATLDEGASTDEILAAIGRIQNNVESQAPTLELKDPFENFDTEEGMQDYLNSYTDIDAGTLNTYSDILGNQDNVESSYMDMAQQADQAALAAFDESNYKSAEDAAAALEELEAAAEDTNDDVEDFEDTMKKLAAGNARASKSLEELTDTFDDNRDAIENSDKTSLEYAEAVSEVQDQIAGLLNVDPDSLSEGFVTSAETMENLQGIIDGDQQALDDLRASAAQDIIQNVAVTMPEENRAAFTENINGFLNQLNAMNLGVNVSANLDDTGYVAKLNDMLANGELTQEQLTNILSAAGYEGHFETEEQTVDPPPLTYTVTRTVTAPGEEKQVITEEVVMDQQPYTAQVPVLKGATQKGGFGSIGPRSSGGGRGGGGGGGKKGGGGGGGGSSYTPKDKDPVEDDIDRYEKVDTVLDSLANQFERIADEQERLTGAELAVNMAEQIDLLKQQVEWQKQKLEIQKQEAAEYKNTLANEYGLTFNEEGFIQNYADKYTEMLNNLNALIAQYNATTTEAGQTALEEQIENAQKSFDKFSELVDNYDDLISNSILESENQIEEFYDKMEDLRIEAFQKSVEAVDNIKDLQEQLIDFNAVFSGMDSDDPFRDMMVATQKLQEYWQLTTGDMNSYYDQLIARNEELMATADEEEKKRLELQNQFYEGAKQNTLSNSNGLGTGYLDMEMNNLNKIMEQIQQYKETGTSEIFGENSAALYETARDIFESATEMILDYEDLLDDLKDAILDAIDELGDAIDRRLEQFENINDELEHYSSIIEMLYGDQAYDLLNQAASATIENSQNYINEIRQDIDVLKDLQSAMEEGSEQWNNLQDMIDEKQQDLLDMTESTLEQIVDMYERSVNQILDKWISVGTGMDDLDWMSEQWELINRNADYYLDDVNAAYEIQKLQNKYLEMLNGADNLAIQNQITQQMQEQLEYLREKDKLSEYDVAYANAQLEILQKRIALEDAQRNKSQLQLRRDTQGNYSYVYTANEDDVFNAQNDLLDAQNNAYNLSKDQIKQTQDDSLSALQDAKDMLNQIWTDANLTLEEKTKRTQVIIDSLREYLAGTSEQLSTAEQNIINDFIGMCELLLDENKGNLDDIYDEIISGNTDAFDQIDDRWNTSITNWLENMDEFDKATADMLENLTQNFEDYTERVEELGDIAGITFDDMTSHINDATDATNNLAQSTSDFINQLKQDSGVIKDYQSQLSAMTAKVQDAENAMKAYADQVRDLQNELVSKELENSNLSDQLGKLEDELENNRNDNSSSSSGGGGGGSSAPAVDESLAWGIAQAIWTYGGASGWGNNPTRSTKLTSSYGTEFAKRVQQIINQHSASGSLVNYDSMKYSSYQLIGYDTGGYTGDWGTNEGNLMANNGKLAWLHQKELVLNQSDTSNILAAVQAVRSMTENFRNGAFEDLVSTLSNYGSDLIAKPAVDMAANGTTEFNVECVFPNATNVEQIQQAILGLPEQVSQFTYRK